MAAASQETEQHTDESHLKLFGVCVDDSEHSARAFDWYLNSCHKEGNKLAIIHIHIPPPLPAVPMYPAGAAIISDEWQRSLQESVDNSRHLIQTLKKKCLKRKTVYCHCSRLISLFGSYLHNIAGIAVADVEWTRGIEDSIKASRNLLHEYRHKCKALKIPYIIFAETDQGSPGAEIARIAKDNGIKMLIMGTRAHGALKRAFLGSISDYVVHHAHCPVTVVPPADKPTEEHPQ
eukprot:gene14370-5418_t